MIITLTGNLLAERTFVCDGWSAGTTLRAKSEQFQVGGKGINVTKMLQRIGEPTTAWCFPGGASGQECEAWLREHRIPHRAFATQTPTRTGLVIHGGEKGETTFLAPDRVPDAAALHACAEALEAARAPGVRLAFCGSFPGWDREENGPLRDALKRWAEEDALDVDTYGPPLRWALEQPTSLIKINRDEFEGLFTENERGQSTGALLATAYARWAVKTWVITDGPNEVVFADAKNSVGKLSPPRVEQVSPTGSGDVVFACLLHALHALKKPLAEAVAYALPYGAANASHPGVADFDLNNLPGTRSFQP